ncbi:MAG: signal peptidase II [Coriobacteriia bacterium]|nr:signal peptidase II [Coriobacteriia bacterium]
MFQAVAAFWFLLDVTTKQLILATMELRETIPLWDGIFHITYTRNYGAAFSILQGQLWLFYLAMALLLVMMIWFWKYEKPSHWTVVVATALIVAGALGNTLDRVTTGSVIDMFDFRAINFAIFNVADIGITIGCVMFLVWFVFVSGHIHFWRKADIADAVDVQVADDIATVMMTAGQAEDVVTESDCEQVPQADITAQPDDVVPTSTSQQSKEAAETQQLQTADAVQQPKEAVQLSQPTLPRPTLRDSIENILRKWERNLEGDDKDESPSSEDKS